MHLITYSVQHLDQGLRRVKATCTGVISPCGITLHCCSGVTDFLHNPVMKQCRHIAGEQYRPKFLWQGLFCIETTCGKSYILCGNAGAPLQYNYIETQVQPKYARYPGIDYVSVFDFPECPDTFNFANNRLTVRPGPFCWVAGSLMVRR